MDAAEDAPAVRRRRADAVRNADAILQAATSVFAESGVDAPMRDIALRAGVGVGTIYRNYPVRSDLIIAVFRHQVDDTAAEAERLGASHPPIEALRRWSARLARFVGTKRGFAAALHSGDPAYAPLPDYFLGTLAPRVQEILDAGAADGSVRSDVRAEDLIIALSRLADAGPGAPPERSERMIRVLLDGMLEPGTASGSPIE